MLIIPAIDLIEGKCVRLFNGQFDKETSYELDPIEVAGQFVQAGAKLIHVVDLDGARMGKLNQLDIIKKICQLGVDVECGGGIRTMGDVDAALKSGVSRVIGGTALYRDHAFRRAFLSLGAQAVAGIDEKAGRVATSGWVDQEATSGIEFASRLADEGCRDFIVTDVSRDGSGNGPNLTFLRAFLSQKDWRVASSGGVGNLEHIKELASMEPSPPWGVIVGKAIYDQRLDVKEAISFVNEIDNLGMKAKDC